MARSLTVVALILALTAGCGEGGGDSDDAGSGRLSVEATVDPRSIEYAPALQIEFSQMEQLPSGLWIRDDLVGTGGEVGPASLATVHYTGYHPDGRTFDSSLSRDEPFTVILGETPPVVILGWEQGIPGMRVGGRRVLVIPPHLAYGERGTPDGTIAPNEVLVFQVDLLAVD